MSNLFKRTGSNRARYDKYEWKEDKEGTLYITPSPDFITYHAVYLPKNHYIKEESMTTEKYLSYFFPFDMIDFVKKAFVAGRPNSVFCSGRCKNRYNVYKSRAKDKDNNN